MMYMVFLDDIKSLLDRINIFSMIKEKKMKLQNIISNILDSSIRYYLA